MSGNQKALLAVCTIVGPWLSDRIPNITSRVRNTPHEQKVRVKFKRGACFKTLGLLTL